MVDERVRLKCRVPLCEHYGVNLMCPPFVLAPDETRAVLARYQDALLVQRVIPLTAAVVERAFDGASYGDVKAGLSAGPTHSAAAEAPSQADEARTKYDDVLRRGKNEFARLMTALEAEAFGLGFRFAAAFGGGECVLCDSCVGSSGRPCPRPFTARPSMEAVGIDVVATAAAAGLPINLTQVDRPMWTGLLLID